MKNIKTFLLASFLALPAIAMGQQLSPRTEALTDWQFSKDSANWNAVTIPHSYNSIDGLSAKYYRGKGWYKRTVNVTPDDLKGQTALLFEGAAQKADVYVNGKHLLHHKGGYTPFYITLKGRLHKGENQIMVVCNNEEDVDLIPVASDFNKNGGLHNPAYFLRFPPVSFSPEGTSLYRLHVSTPKVSAKEAQTIVTVNLSNASGKDQNLTLQYTLKDAKGNVIISKTKSVSMAKAVKMEKVDEELTFSNPHLWQGTDDPYLYTMLVALVDAQGNSLDRVETKVGYRFFHLDKDKGFFLNGKSYPLRGVAEHQDMSGKASALSKTDFDNDYKIIKELGCNFLRLAHYPHNDYAFRLCDSLGIIVQTEIPWVNVCGVNAKPVYFETIHSQMREMVQALYNHPSIVFWGMWNELDTWGNTDQYQGEIDFQRVQSETAKLYDYTRSLDPYRPIGVTDCSVYSNPLYNQLKGDFHSENRYNGWYYDQGYFDGFSKSMHQIHDALGVCNVSEYGVGVNPYCHTYITDTKAMRDNDKQHYEEYGNLFHESYARQIQAMPFLNFTSVWVLFDFPVASRHEGYLDSNDGQTFTENPQRKYTNDKGLVTRNRKIKKDAFYLYKSLWNKKETTVYITSRRRNVAPASGVVPVKVYSNASTLTLKVNGKIVQTIDRCNDSTGVIWEFNPVTLQQGDNTIEVTGSGVTDKVVINRR